MKLSIHFYLESAVVELHFSDGPYAFINCTLEEYWPEMLTVSHIPYEAFKLLDTDEQLLITDFVDLMDFWSIPDLLGDDELQYRINMLFADYPAVCRMLYKMLYKWLKDITEKNPETVQQLTDSFLTELGELSELEELDQEDQGEGDDVQ